MRDTTEARGKLDPVVVHRQIPGCAGTDVQHDLAVLDETGWHARTRIDRHQQLRGIARVRTPFVQCADQVRLG
ncbi:hypothetical protein SDC9_202857 [bioreactor metagenome]|uniref:Uncharacterized protein n=1 Tax=bioreactor metagenome TaxID=1076179 RepID=A0A645IUU2_9ZZZZ